MATKTAAKFISNKLGQLVTPKGSALFISCPNASSFDETRQEASILLSADDYAAFKAQIDALVAAYEGELVVDPTTMEMPVKDATDKEGAPTGEFIVKAKTGMRFPAKLYDANSKQFAPAPGFSVANRSTIKLSVSAELISTKVYKGLVLRLNGVQIISANPFVGANPFGAEDGDFDATTPVVAQDEDTSDWAD